MARVRFLFALLLIWTLQACTPAGPVTGQHRETASPRSAPATRTQDLELVLVDVGQGDGMFMRTPDGYTMVVDAGFKGRGRALVSELQAEGIKDIDLLVLSHPHADHIGGAIHLVKGFNVREIWLSGAPSATRVHLRLLEAINQAKIPTKLVRAGDTRKLGDQVQLAILGPEEPLLTGTRSDANANSIVLWVKHGEIDFLLTGDAEKETEERVLEVLRARPPPDFEVLKVAHHGSRYASGRRFLSRVSPKVALISCGARNRYRHPAPETLERLRDVGAKIYRTDLHGSIRVRSNGHSFWVAE